MKIEKSMIPTLWYENEKGERFIPPEGGEPAPKGFIYQHTQFPRSLHHLVLRAVLREEVDACEHPAEHVHPTGGWIDGVEGRECKCCNGTQTRKTGEPWPERWEADGARQLIHGEQGWPESLALAMANSGKWTLSEAILIAANSCERCMNALAHEYGLDWGYPIHSENWQKANTSCAFCADEPKPDRGPTHDLTRVAPEGGCATA